MRPLTFEEREDLCRRADGDVLDFVHEVERLGRKYRYSQDKVLSILLHAPTHSDVEQERVLDLRERLAEGGTEFTPDELIDTIGKMCAKVRNELRARGWGGDKVPDSDTAIMTMLAEVLNG